VDKPEARVDEELANRLGFVVLPVKWGHDVLVKRSRIGCIAPKYVRRKKLGEEAVETFEGTLVFESADSNEDTAGVLTTLPPTAVLRLLYEFDAKATDLQGKRG